MVESIIHHSGFTTLVPKELKEQQNWKGRWKNNQICGGGGVTNQGVFGDTNFTTWKTWKE
jgi:hypothetical protein